MFSSGDRGLPEPGLAAFGRGTGWIQTTDGKNKKGSHPLAFERPDVMVSDRVLISQKDRDN